MSFLTEAQKSVNDARVLVEVDITDLNSQWVNNGAGVWVYNLDVSYSWVDDTLLDASWTASDLANVGSVRSDNLLLTEVSALASLTPSEFFWDAANSDLYICLADYDEPYIHEVRVGFVYGFSHDEFTPSGMDNPQLYQGRLVRAPIVSIARDPLFFGRLSYGGGSFDIINRDGEYDTFAIDNNLYGNEVRVRLGFDDLAYADYQRIFTGYIADVDVGEDVMHIAVSDLRKQLSREITYSCTAENPLTAIREILTTYFGASYDTDYFDTTAWRAATNLVDIRGLTVTIDMQDSEPAIDVIEGLCVDGLSIFFKTADNKYSCNGIWDETCYHSSTVCQSDVIEKGSMHYGTQEVISSVKVGYAKNWLTTGTAYTRYTYDEYEASVYAAYQTYNQKSFDTFLDTKTSADNWATAFYPMFTEVHGSINVTLPLEYYDKDVEECFQIELNRQNTTMFGTVPCSIKSMAWDLEGVPTINYELRVI